MSTRLLHAVMNGSAWQVLRDLQAWQITQLARRPHARQDSGTGQDQADRGASQRLQALVSAFHFGAPVAFGWIREQDDDVLTEVTLDELNRLIRADWTQRQNPPATAEGR